VAAAAETRMSHIVARVTAAPAAAPESLSRQVRDTVRGTRRKVVNHDISSDLEDKSPHPRTSTSIRKGHLRAGRQGKCGRGEIQPSGVALLPVSAGKQD